MGQPAGAARAIARAPTTSFPRPRYLIGLDAQALLLAERLTPPMLKDRVVRLGLGI